MSEYSTFEEEEFYTSFDGRTFLRLLSLMKPHWPWVAGFLFCITSVSFIEAYLTFLGARLIDEAIIPGNLDALRSIMIQWAVLIVLLSAGVFGFIYLTGILGQRIRYDLRKRLFNHLQDLSFSYYDKTPVGWIMSRVTSDTMRMGNVLTWGLLDSTWGIMAIISGVIFMLAINWQLALVVILIVPLLWIVATEFRKRIIKYFRLARRTNSQITANYAEMIQGVRVIKAMAREEKTLGEFGVLTSRMYDASYRAAWWSALFLPAVQLITAFGIGAIAWYGGWQTTVGTMTIGGIQAFVGYVTMMMFPIQEMARVYAELQQAIASAERVFSLSDAVPDVQDRSGAAEVESIAGEIVFENVNFHYEPQKPVLKQFNLRVAPGETLAIVGPTGAGKSTIINLMCRFYEPTGGRILINGRDYTEISLHSIHSQLGIVLQTPHLFSGTIRDNLRYGRMDATNEEVIEAAKVTGVHVFIMALEEDYDSQVGEGGVLLSTGQKQLISLTRAVLADPEILIMDEATSSVDTLTESLIQRSMDTLMVDRTTFIIAHRLSTIKKADRIIVLNAGEIEEMGTHRELLKLKGHYYSLYTKQFRSEAAARESAAAEVSTQQPVPGR
ncbi:MAG: ABC transporter ATP-binding protein [Chloroflexi bacterium]|nr:ABC transporter ATP-binding protein [Chloroflexota bacterium]